MTTEAQKKIDELPKNVQEEIELRIWPQEQVHGLTEEEMQALRDMAAFGYSLAMQERQWIKVTDALPAKPGKSNYEHVPCNVYIKGYGVSFLMWNCEELVWDDADRDDVSGCNYKVTHWQLAPLPPNE